MSIMVPNCSNHMTYSHMTWCLSIQVVFVLTYNRQNPNTNLYRSSDYGKTFTNINKNIGDGVSLTNAIYVSPEDPKTVRNGNEGWSGMGMRVGVVWERGLEWYGNE